MEDRYTRKYNLLLEKFMEIDGSNEKLQNRICHIRKQIRYLRRLKRLLIQKLVIYGDRFMDVCLEIPDMEPGANVADQIIRRVAEVPHPATPPISQHQQQHQQQQSIMAGFSKVNSIVANVLNSSGVGSSPGSEKPPAKKRRRTTTHDNDPSPISVFSSTIIGSDNPLAASMARSVSYQQPRKPVVAVASNSGASTPSSSIFLQSRRESVDGNQSMAATTVSSTPTTSSLQMYYPYPIPASVEDVVNSVVFDCRQDRRNKEEAYQKMIKDETCAVISMSSTPSISDGEREKFDFKPVFDEEQGVDGQRNATEIVKPKQELHEQAHGEDEPMPLAE